MTSQDGWKTDINGVPWKHYNDRYQRAKGKSGYAKCGNIHIFAMRGPGGKIHHFSVEIDIRGPGHVTREDAVALGRWLIEASEGADQGLEIGDEGKFATQEEVDELNPDDPAGELFISPQTGACF
jgi:hypothetical protein